MSGVMRFVFVDDHEHHLIGRVLEDAAPGHPAAAAWRSTGGPLMVVHGLRDAGHLLRIPDHPAHRDWLVDQLRTLAETADRSGRILGCVPAWFAEQVADRIADEQAPAGEPGSVRVGAEDLRALLDATDAWAASLSPAIRTDEREEQAALYDVSERVGTLAAMTWTEPIR